MIAEVFKTGILGAMNSEDINGYLILLMAPSGSGKGKMIEGLGDLTDSMYFIKTFTSRERRIGTIENPKYNFVSREQFEEMIKNQEFIEWANFSGNYMGTPKSEVIEALTTGKIAFKEMELQGILQMKKLVPENKMTVIYIDAGNWDELERRVTSRAAINAEELALRKQRYEEESKWKVGADVIIHNYEGKLEDAQNEFKTVVKSIIENK